MTTLPPNWVPVMVGDDAYEQTAGHIANADMFFGDLLARCGGDDQSPEYLAALDRLAAQGIDVGEVSE